MPHFLRVVVRSSPSRPKQWRGLASSCPTHPPVPLAPVLADHFRITPLTASHKAFSAPALHLRQQEMGLEFKHTQITVLILEQSGSHPLGLTHGGFHGLAGVGHATLWGTLSLLQVAVLERARGLGSGILQPLVIVAPGLHFSQLRCLTWETRHHLLYFTGVWWTIKETMGVKVLCKLPMHNDRVLTPLSPCRNGCGRGFRGSKAFTDITVLFHPQNDTRRYSGSGGILLDTATIVLYVS